MYIPKHFAMKDEDEVYAFVQQYPFASLVSLDVDGIPEATHVPLILDENKAHLIGHFARANHQWKTIEGQRALAIFLGAHSYISSSWYETQKAVSTWNYESVHVYGTMEYLRDDELHDALKQLVLTYEDTFLEDSDYIEGMKKGVVGFKMKITELQGKSKLSQNHSRDRQRRVIAKLQQSEREDDQQIAKRMKENEKNKEE
ncbi:protease synthase and sporulation negative regulatory protein PAI 2 [Geomicrobium sp. JCM 19037]|uniref:FMN-binding negative transcriptional regulator n=1 Tax=unclassified Geomicrobium TaxID=2628951 RepID=UPI00045F3506|nr:FMN-binding negative transcriptional regulator [Geomicrobium sp. JCM 19037]GAK03596.1 protease synthase and sporulation negative regulatory protein PAI 2 [Geomicrobium sp. JCM 19037]